LTPLQARWVLGAHLVSESAWVFGLLGLAGLVFGQGGSIMSWPGLLAVMALSVLIRPLVPVVSGAATGTYAIRVAIGAAAVYVAISVGSTEGGFGLNFGWPGGLFSEYATGSRGLALAASALVGVVMWWRAGFVSAVEFPREALEQSFKFGIPAVAVTVVFDIANEANLHAFEVVLAFFAASMAGLIIGRLSPASVGAAGVRVIIGAAAGVLVIGLASAVGFFSFLADVFEPVYNAVLQVVVWVVVMPIALVYYVILLGFIWVFGGLFRRLFGEGGFQWELSRSPLQDLFDETGETQVETAEAGSSLAQYGEWALIIILVAAALGVLVLAARRSVRKRAAVSEYRTESVREEADVSADLGKLLSNLTPGWLRRGDKGPRLTPPDGPAGVVEVFEVYYDLLELAEERGYGKPPAQTPDEYLAILEGKLPSNVVREVTAAFNRACYGFLPSTDGQIERMRAGVKALATT